MSERDLKRLAKRILIEATPERVWQALTNQDELEVWLGEHVVLEPKVGGRFAVWGKGTYGAAIPLDQPGIIQAIEENRSLTVGFDFKGKIKTIATFRLEANEKGIALIASYELPENCESLPWYWTKDQAIVMLFNLQSYVETGRAACLLDDPSADQDVILAITISASPSDAFAALTRPEEMDKWVSEAATVDLRVGGEYRYGWTETSDSGEEIPVGPIEILAFEQDQLLKHNWRYSLEPPTQVTWEIEGEGGSTTVKLTHSGFGLDSDVPGYIQGWTAFLCMLKALLEGKAMVEEVA